jgi:GAF domain-containing protein
MAVFPLIVSNEWLGVLIGQSKGCLPASHDEEARQINNLTDQAATVIENRRLIQQTQEALQETEVLYTS